MLGWLFLGLITAGLLKMAKAPASTSVAIPALDWPSQTNNALATGKHYFFVVPLVSKPSAALLATTLSALGFADVKVYVPGAGPAGMPEPHPAHWEGSPLVRVTGRWTGGQGAPLDLSSLAPYGFDATGQSGKVAVWMPTEDYVGMHASKL